VSGSLLKGDGVSGSGENYITRGLGPVLLTKFYSSDQMKTMLWVGHVARLFDRRNAHGVPVGKIDGMRTFGLPRSRWKFYNEVEGIKWWLVL